MAVRVVILGVTGKMGQEVLRALVREPGMEPVGGIARRRPSDWLPLPDSSGQLPLFSTVEEALEKVGFDVLVDFSSPEATRRAAPVALKHRVNAVIGTSGLTPEDLEYLDRTARENDAGVVVAPNFAVGAVLLIHLSKIAARFFDHAEITERHHHQKADAPSGTALATARAMLEARGRPFELAPTQRENLPGTRGGELGGIAIHSQRLPGTMAYQEVILGGPGQTLTLCHEAINRECYIPGVLLAIREVIKIKGLVHGLERLLGI